MEFHIIKVRRFTINRLPAFARRAEQAHIDRPMDELEANYF
jgi:hypothetical protein